VVDSKDIKLSLWKIAKFPLACIICSLSFFTLAFFFFPGVFQIVLYINTIAMIITMIYAVIFGLIPLFFKRKPKGTLQSEFVSIIIPVFNDGEVLEKNLQNLVKLRYPNYEILVVYSEKSTDSTKEVALKFAQEYPNIHAFSENVSRGYGLNIGIDNAKGEFLLFLDSDTFIFNDFIEKTLSYFTSPDIKMVNSCFLGLNSTYNILTRISWSLSNSIAFYGIGINKYLKNISFMGFGGIWRKKALIECGKFATDSVLDDSELNLRAGVKFPHWKGIFDDNLFCYQFFPTNFKTFYLQQLHWHLGNFRYSIQGIRKLKQLGLRQKFLYISQFLAIDIIPLITLFSLGMIVVQFFANFFYPNLSFGGGLFYFGLGILSFAIMFITMFLFAYPKYRKSPHAKLSRKTIIGGIFVIIYIVGLIFAVVSLNALKELFKRKKGQKEVFVKVDKSKLDYSAIPT